MLCCEVQASIKTKGQFQGVLELQDARLHLLRRKLNQKSTKQYLEKLNFNLTNWATVDNSLENKANSYWKSLFHEFPATTQHDPLLMWLFYMPTKTKIECFIREMPTIWKWMEIRRRLSSKNDLQNPNCFVPQKVSKTANSSNNKSGICFRSIRMLAAGRTIKGNSRLKGFHNWSAFFPVITNASLTFTTIEDWIIRWRGDEVRAKYDLFCSFSRNNIIFYFSRGLMKSGTEWHSRVSQTNRCCFNKA